VPERTIARLAAARGRRVWLVGGPVRDRLLGRGGGDLDLSLDGKVREIGRAAARELGGAFRWHPRFLTGRIELPQAHIDIARTRTETYPAPAALPRVKPGSIEADLGRRDFTINAMAIEIRTRGRGRLLDPFEGRSDLDAGVVRALHDRSFNDDPTRAFRALRFATRFGFRIALSTRGWMRAAIAERAHERLSGERVAAELRRAWNEERPAAVLRAFHDAGLDSFWGSGTLSPALRRLPKRRARLPFDPAIFFAAAFGHRPDEQRQDLAGRLRLTRGEKRALIDGPGRAAEIILLLRRALGPAAFDRACSRAAEGDLLLAALGADSPTFGRIVRWWRVGREVALEIDGSDLRAAGMPAGPGVARALARARAALIEGHAPDREAQLRAALRT
jgi:tRNA nucleotidyltransferase (CCA-adding enzyme)